MIGMGGRIGPPTPGQTLERVGGRTEKPIEVTQRAVRKARVVKLKTFEQVRRVEIEMFQSNTTFGDLELAMEAWIAGNPVDVLSIETDSSIAFNEDNNTTIRLFTGTIVYMPDDDQATFELAINTWLLAAGEKDFIEIQYQHTDRVYRALILYAE
jgi:hypothetical protein